MKRVAIATVGAAALAATLTVGQPSVADTGSAQRQVELQDDCDPATFNAVLGEGVCVGEGDTTFDELVESLLEGDPDGHWRNHPDETHVRRGASLIVSNSGGELHTFTEVAAFGPGCEPGINRLLGLSGPPAADCDAAFGEGGSALPPGGFVTVTTAGMTVGTHKFMCMVHPWMQTTVEVRRR